MAARARQERQEIARAHGIFDEDGHLYPKPTPTQEFIALYPVPYAVVSAKMLLFSAGIVLCLVLHNAVLLRRAWPAEESYAQDYCLLLLCSVRVAAAIPRPILWWHIFRLYSQAASERSALRVAQRLVAATRDTWVRCNSVLNNVYNGWLLLLLTRLCYGCVCEKWQWWEGRTQFELALGWHATWCLLFMIASHLTSAIAILYKIHMGAADQPMRARQLDHCTQTVLVDDPLLESLSDETCIICFAPLERGQHARRLQRCGHTFHQACIDGWLLRHQAPTSINMSCPICSCEICPPDNDLQEESDPLVSRELVWLAEVRRGHPGMVFL